MRGDASKGECVAVAALQTVGAVVVVVVELGNRSIGCGSGRCDCGCDIESSDAIGGNSDGW